MRCERFGGAQNINSLFHRALNGRCPRADGCGCYSGCNNTCVNGCSNSAGNCGCCSSSVCGCSSCNNSCVNAGCDCGDSCNCYNSCDSCDSCNDCGSCVCGCDSIQNSNCAEMSECEINSVVYSNEFATLVQCQNGNVVSVPVLVRPNQNSCACNQNEFLLLVRGGCSCNGNISLNAATELLFTQNNGNCRSLVVLDGSLDLPPRGQSSEYLRFIPQSVTGTRCCIG